MARFLLVLGLLLASGCAGTKPPPPAESPEPAAPAPSAPATPPPANASIACRARPTVCAEYQGLTADDAAKIGEQCSREGGSVLDACPAEKIVGACAATRPTMTVRQVVYRAKTARETRGLVATSKRACETNGGTFTTTQ